MICYFCKRNGAHRIYGTTPAHQAQWIMAHQECLGRFDLKSEPDFANEGDRDYYNERAEQMP